MNVINWLSEKVAERISTIIGGLMVSKAERAALRSHVDDLEDIEARAKQLEESGNPALAEYLRTQSRHLTDGGPGTAAALVQKSLAAPSHLAGEQFGQPAVLEFTGNGTAATKKKRGRPKKSAPVDSGDSEITSGGDE